MFLIMKDYTSSYQIWNLTAKNPDLDPNIDIKPMAYNNVNKRILNLHKNGYLEVVKHQDKSNAHKRKDYKITMKGIEYLIPYLLLQSKNFEIISKYISRSGLDRQAFETKLGLKIFNILDSGNSYYEVAGKILILPSNLITEIQIKDIREPKPVTKIATAAGKPKRI
jgi:hypothetical protein